MTDTQQPELTEDGRQRRTIKSFVMRAGRMPKKLYASASSPLDGLIK